MNRVWRGSFENVPLGFIAIAGAVMLLTANASAITAAQIQAAEADSTAFVLRDDRFRTECSATSVQMGADGSLALEGVSCADVTLAGDQGNLKFQENGDTTHSCNFGSMTMNITGNMIITAEGDCFVDGDGDAIPDLIDPLPSEAAGNACVVQGDSPNESVSMSSASFIADASCALPAPNQVVSVDTSIGSAETSVIMDFIAKDGIDLIGGTVRGNSTLTLQGDGQGQPVVRIWTPFTLEAGSVLSIQPSIPQ